jgi:hypothetical protein
MYDKPITPREPTFELNEFNEPLELTGPKAWIRDVVAMAFYEPGTFSDDPDLGVNVNGELYTFAEESAARIRTNLTAACDKYLGDIPMTELIVSTYLWEEMDTYVTVITASFKQPKNVVMYNAYVSIIDHQLRYVVSQIA